LTSNKFRSLSYGQNLHDIENSIGSTGQRSFIIRQTNTVFECRTIYVDDTRKIYSLLFENGVFSSIWDERTQRTPWGHWKGFGNLTDPDFSKLDFFLKDFFPPKPLPEFQFTNPPNPERVPSWGEEHEGLGMMIGLAPFWVPAAPIGLPIMAASMKKDERWYKGINSFKTGESEADVLKILGKPSKKIGNDYHSVWAYSNRMTSLGFENGELVWILGLDATGY